MTINNKRRQKKASTFSYRIASFVFIITILIGASFFFLYPFPSKEKVAYFSADYPIIFQEEVFENEAMMIDDVIYISYNFLQNKIDPNIHYDDDSDSVIITTKDKVVQIPNQDLTGFINNEPFTFEVPVLVAEHNKRYIHLDPLLSIYPLQLQYNKNDRVVFIYEQDEEIVSGKVVGELSVHEARLRTEPTVTSPYTEEVERDELVFIEDTLEDYYFVRKDNGIAGYIEKQFIEVIETRKIEVDVVKQTFDLPQLNKPIHLTWEAVYSRNPRTFELPNMEGVNVVSPTWFHIKNGEGDVSNLASYEFIDWAHQKGFHVWALFSNSFDPDITHEALSSFATRQKIIKQLITYSSLYHLEGINVDFENVYLEDGPLVTQFMRELTPYLHEAGLIVSMDVTFISSSEMWSKFYEREQLAEIVDYMIVMAYDEHWASSPMAGSVASLPWVENHLKNILEVIPQEKLILGIPLYTRLWKEQETEGGNIEVSSKALSMDEVITWMNERNIEPSYDSQSGQNYVQYYDENEKATYKIWLEDDTSLRKRVDLINKYGLEGIASWARSFANDSAWKTLADALHAKEK